RERECTSFPDPALDPNSPAVRVDDALRDRQPQAGSACARSVCRLPIPVEDAIEMLARDPCTSIPYRKNQPPIAIFGAYNDPPVARRELDRVTQEVSEHLNDSNVVGPNERKIGRNAGAERDSVLLRFDLEHVEGLQHHLRWILFAQLQGEMPQFDARHV